MPAMALLGWSFSGRERIDGGSVDEFRTILKT